MLNDIETVPTTVNWLLFWNIFLLKHILLSLGFQEVWVQQGVGNYNAFISVLKQRLTDTIIKDWRARQEETTRANFYKSFAVF